MELQPSVRIGPYEIVSRIGAGGMGEVWRARDTRIGRDVALKTLPGDFALSPERLRRFELEARAAGSLSHPNLVTIHDVGSHEGTPYIVMELLEGDTLRERIGGDTGGPRIPVRKALEMSVQIASGLAAAHEKGIVHRDLKPENVFVMRDGRVKILDFGLAKLAVANDDPSDDSRTQQRDTTPGAVVGTAGYMSPEQVRGQPVDHRTDVFAFGAILYEALTGRRAFRRDSSVETMNAILTEDPPEASSSAHHIPPAIDRIVRRCLEKAPEERFQSARDLAFALEAVGGASTASQVGAAGAGLPAARRANPRVLMAAMAVALAIAVAALGAYRLGMLRSKPLAPPTFSQLTFDGGVETSPSIAPDGETFAYVRDGDIFVRRVDGRNAINLTKSPDAGESTPAFSPDGRLIAFRGRGGLYLMGATGESVRRLSAQGFDPSWAPDGKRLVYSRQEESIDPRSRNTTTSPLWVFDFASSKEAQIYGGDAMQPRWSPGGGRIAFWANDDAGRRNIFTIASDGSKESLVPVTSDDALDWNPVWSPDGKWLYFSSDRGGTVALWRVTINETTGLTRGEPQLLPAPAPWVGRLSIASNGKRLLFQTASRTNALHLARFDAATETLTIDEKPILYGSLLIRSVSVSPDGNLVAFTTDSPEDVFVMNRDGSDIRQLTNDEKRDRGATWTADSQKIGFYSTRSGNYQIWTIRPDGSDLTQVTDLPHEFLPNFPLFSPDQRSVASVSGRGIWFIADLTSLPVKKAELLPKTPSGDEFFAKSWSPDGRMLAGNAWGRDQALQYVYDIEKKTYAPIARGSDARWIDNDRLLIRDEEGFSTVNLRTGAVKQILKTHFAVPPAASASGEHLAVATSRTEADIWMATLKEE